MSEPAPSTTAGATSYAGPRRPATDAERRALASTLRLRILRYCLGEPRTNREIALRLARNPATVLHHVRTLVATGFLEARPARRGTRGAREVPYLATGKSWFMEMAQSPHDLLLATFLEQVAEVGEAELDSTWVGLRLTEPEWQEFGERLHAVLEEYRQRPVTPGARPWSVYLGKHPEPN